MGLKKASSAPSYLDLLQPMSRETWMLEGNCREDRRPSHMLRYWLMNRKNNADPSGITEAQYQMALALCEMCPVQWRCVSFAINNRDKYHIWAVDTDDRKVLRHEPLWEFLIQEAEENGHSVRSVVVELRAQAAARAAAAALLDHSESVHSAV